MNRIHCKLKGGLGNMLFQIAAAKSFALDVNCDCNFPNLMENLQMLNNDATHNPELKHSFEYLQIFPGLLSDSIDDLSDIKYEGFPFNYESKKVQPNSIIDGFFQSEKYFVRHRSTILKSLNFDFVTDEYISQRYPYLKDSRVTSIHVRRGDYVRNPLCHPPQTAAYYQMAADHLRCETDIWMIFSDDLSWCREVFQGDNVKLVENEKDYIELKLMSMCSNHITCNSSFSWWGAWMNSSTAKRVVGPTRWFGPKICHDTSDILPDTWIKI